MLQPALRPTGLPRALRSASALLVLALGPACDGGGSAPEPSPVPVIAELTPAYIFRGGAEVTVVVTGTGFAGRSEVRFNGAARPTEFVSATELRARLSAADLAQPRFNTVTVFTPAPGGGTSNAAELGVRYPSPEITSVSPAQLEVGGPAVTVTVRGTGFFPETRAQAGSEPRPLTLVSPTEVRVELTAADRSSGQDVLLVLENPNPGGGFATRTITFIQPVPAVTALSPATVTAGSPGVPLQVLGTGFTVHTRLFVGGQERMPVRVSATELRVTLSDFDMAASGMIPVYVQNPAPGGGASNTAALTVRAAVPAITQLFAASVPVGAPEAVVQVAGTGFAANTEARFDGAPRPTRWRGPTVVEITLAAADLAAAGTHQVTVFNPAPGGGLSNAAAFTVANPLPVITGFSPEEAPLGSAGVTVTVFGRNFAPGARVVVRPLPPLLSGVSVERAATYVSPAELWVALAAADLAGHGYVALHVRNPAPGGGTSVEMAMLSVLAPAPVLASLTPEFTSDGQASFTLRVDGTSFVPRSVVELDGRARPTRYLGPTRLEATLGPDDVAWAGVREVGVHTPEPGGGRSARVYFQVRAPVPTIASLGTTQVAAGGPSFVLVVNGTGFRSYSRVRIDDTDLNTFYRSATRVEAEVPFYLLTLPRTATIRVSTDGPVGGGVSNGATFQVVAPAP